MNESEHFWEEDRWLFEDLSHLRDKWEETQESSSWQGNVENFPC